MTCGLGERVVTGTPETRVSYGSPTMFSPGIDGFGSWGAFSGSPAPPMTPAHRRYQKLRVSDASVWRATAAVAFSQAVTDTLARGQLAASEAPESRAAAVRRNVQAIVCYDDCCGTPRLRAALGEKLLEAGNRSQCHLFFSDPALAQPALDVAYSADDSERRIDGAAARARGRHAPPPSPSPLEPGSCGL